MSKRRKKSWNDDAFMFSGGQTTAQMVPHALLQQQEEAQEVTTADAEFMDDAHEALSRLYNQVAKRGKQVRGVKRREAWD